MYRASFLSSLFVLSLVAMGCQGSGVPAGGQGGASGIGGTTATGGTTVTATGGTTVTATGGTTVTATGGTTVTATGGTTTSGTGGTSANGTGGASATAGCDKDLSGTWDLFASSTGTGIVRGTLVVSKDGFSFTAGSTQLTYTGAGTQSATWKYSGYYGPTTRLISVQNTAAAVDSGSLPLALGGQWTLASNSETCVLNVTPSQVTGKCTGRAGDYNVGGDDWPFELMDSPENRVSYTTSRSATATSQFGELGGTWSAHSDTGSGQGCTFKLENNTATSTCRASNSFNGNLHLTIGADCVASGVTPSGAEVSARRR
jgi:hypothetical protein